MTTGDNRQPTASPYEATEVLFTALAIGPRTLNGRIVSTSHQTGLVENHVPTPDLVAYHEARARGGAAMVMIEATSVDDALLTGHTIAGHRREVVGAYRAIADAVHPHGTLVLAQLCHGGRESLLGGYRPALVSASAVPSPRYLTEPRALRVSEIEALVDAHRVAAANAAAGGLDGVECLAGFDYLPGQFLSPETNRRSDAYGGSAAHRRRLLVEILRALRDGIGRDGVVGVRLTAATPHAGIADAEEVCALVGALCAEDLIDYVSIAIGSSATFRGSTWIVPPAPLDGAVVATAARRVRDASTVPVIATSGIRDPLVAARLVGGGSADAVGMTRALIADPELPRKARAGRLDEIDRCIGCNQGCIGHYHAGTPINCTINPRAGRERRLGPIGAAAGGTVVIVGGGPAGCAAARACGGDRVILFERAGQLGGQWLHALAGPSHRSIAEAMLANLRRWCARAGTELRLGVEAQAAEIAALQPDRVVLATGARPHVPTLVRSSGAPAVVDAWAVLDGADVDGPAVVWEWGGDWTGLITAELLAQRGVAVRLVSAAAAFGAGIHQYQRNLYLERLHVAGVELVHHLRPVAVQAGSVHLRHVFSDLPVVLENVATLVVTAGREPCDELLAPLLSAGLSVRRAGDCQGPRTAEEAVHEGTLAGLEAAVAGAIATTPLDGGVTSRAAL